MTQSIVSKSGVRTYNNTEENLEIIAKKQLRYPPTQV